MIEIMTVWGRLKPNEVEGVTPAEDAVREVLQSDCCWRWCWCVTGWVWTSTVMPVITTVTILYWLLQPEAERSISVAACQCGCQCSIWTECCNPGRLVLLNICTIFFQLTVVWLTFSLSAPHTVTDLFCLSAVQPVLAISDWLTSVHGKSGLWFWSEQCPVSQLTITC